MSSDSINVLLYSDHAGRRQAVVEGIGLKPAKDLPAVNWIEAATGPGAVQKFQESQVDILVLDAESTKVGGMALAKELVNEQDAEQPIVLLTARPQDHWLGEWAGAAEIITDPLDPIVLQETLAKVIRGLK